MPCLAPSGASLAWELSGEVQALTHVWSLKTSRLHQDSEP